MGNNLKMFLVKEFEVEIDEGEKTIKRAHFIYVVAETKEKLKDFMSNHWRVYDSDGNSFDLDPWKNIDLSEIQEMNDAEIDKVLNESHSLNRKEEILSKAGIADLPGLSKRV